MLCWVDVSTAHSCLPRSLLTIAAAVGLVMGFIYGTPALEALACIPNAERAHRGLQYNEIWGRTKRDYEDAGTIHAWIRRYLWVQSHRLRFTHVAEANLMPDSSCLSAA